MNVYLMGQNSECSALLLHVLEVLVTVLTWIQAALINFFVVFICLSK